MTKYSIGVTPEIVEHLHSMKSQNAKPIEMLYYLASLGLMQITLIRPLRDAFSIAVIRLTIVAYWHPKGSDYVTGISDEEVNDYLTPLIYGNAADE